MSARGVALLLAGMSLGVLQAGWQARDRQSVAIARSRLADGVLRAIILGDSVAHGAGDEQRLGIGGFLQREFPAAQIVNLGINGARTFNVAAILRQRSVRSAVRIADVLVISVGGNDLYGDLRARALAALSPDRAQAATLSRIQRLVGSVRSINPAVRIYLLGLYDPYRQPWLDHQVNLWDSRLIARFASARDVTVVRICDLLTRADRISNLDHFHPGAAGYAAIAARIASSM